MCSDQCSDQGLGGREIGFGKDQEEVVDQELSGRSN